MDQLRRTVIPLTSLVATSPLQEQSPVQASARLRSVSPTSPSTTAAGGLAVAAQVHTPGAGRLEKPWVKTLIGGVVTIVFEMAGGHALEFLKIDKQVSNDSYMTIIRRMTANKGLAGCLDGFFPWGAMQATVKGGVFSWGQAASRRMLHGNAYLNDQATMVLSGGCGGFVQGVFMSPMLLLKTRVITHPQFRSSGGVLETTIASSKLGAQIVRTEGAGVLMKGMGVFSAKRFADWTTRFLFVEIVQGMVASDGRKLSKAEKAMCALAGGTLSALATVPIDVMVATIQDAGKSGQKVSVMKVFSDAAATGGIKGTIQLATRGLAARVAHVALTTLMMKTVTSAVYDTLYPPTA